MGYRCYDRKGRPRVLARNVTGRVEIFCKKCKTLNVFDATRDDGGFVRDLAENMLILR